MNKLATDSARVTTAAPWHLWTVAGVGLLWNGFGAYDYLMSHMQPETYLPAMGMTAPQIAYFNAMPAWMTSIWAIGVWGAVLGTVLLFLRHRLASPVFAVSLAAFLVSLVYQYVLTDGAAIMGTTVVVMSVVVLVGCVAFAAYARAMTKNGVLR